MSIASRQATLYTKDKLEEGKKVHRLTKTLTLPVTTAENSQWVVKGACELREHILHSVCEFERVQGSYFSKCNLESLL